MAEGWGRIGEDGEKVPSFLMDYKVPDWAEATVVCAGEPFDFEELEDAVMFLYYAGMSATRFGDGQQFLFMVVRKDLVDAADYLMRRAMGKDKDVEKSDELKEFLERMDNDDA